LFYIRKERKMKNWFPPIEVSKHDKKVASIPAFVYLPVILGYSYLAGTGLATLLKRVGK
jgi:hypothetical protein